jgi:hypothetical protein
MSSSYVVGEKAKDSYAYTTYQRMDKLFNHHEMHRETLDVAQLCAFRKRACRYRGILQGISACVVTITLS